MTEPSRIYDSLNDSVNDEEEFMELLDEMNALLALEAPPSAPEFTPAYTAAAQTAGPPSQEKKKKSKAEQRQEREAAKQAYQQEKLEKESYVQKVLAEKRMDLLTDDLSLMLVDDKSEASDTPEDTNTQASLALTRQKESSTRERIWAEHARHAFKVARGVQRHGKGGFHQRQAFATRGHIRKRTDAERERTSVPSTPTPTPGWGKLPSVATKREARQYRQVRRKLVASMCTIAEGLVESKMASFRRTDPGYKEVEGYGGKKGVEKEDISKEEAAKPKLMREFAFREEDGVGRNDDDVGMGMDMDVVPTPFPSPVVRARFGRASEWVEKMEGVEDEEL